MPNLKFNDDVLLCPHCKSEYLHQEQVDIYDRQEDQETGIRISASVAGQKKFLVDQSLEGNPSLRRDGISVRFGCEGCNKSSRLTIAQHKGQTLVAFS